MGSYLGRAAILKADDLGRREVHVPEWADPETGADTVLVRGLTGSERDEYEESCMKQRPRYDASGKAIPGQMEMVRSMDNIRAKLVARSCIDEDGTRLFTELDVGALGQKSASALDRVFTACAELSRLGEDDIDELAGKSGSAPSGGSTSS